MIVNSKTIKITFLFLKNLIVLTQSEGKCNLSSQRIEKKLLSITKVFHFSTNHIYALHQFLLINSRICVSGYGCKINPYPKTWMQSYEGHLVLEMT